MAETPSTMIPLGTSAPNFTLLDTLSNKQMSLVNLKSEIATVIMFICNHCPYVKHIQEKMVEVAQSYQEKGIQFIAINSNDVEAYPDDSPEKMQDVAKQHHYPFPYLFDATQEVAKAYHAACTPDFYIFDKNLRCIYRGRFDSSTPGNKNPVTGADIIDALENILVGKSVNTDQKASVGCNIKWKRK